MRRGFSFLWVVLTGSSAAVVGVASYQAGISTPAAGGRAVPPVLLRAALLPVRFVRAF